MKRKSVILLVALMVLSFTLSGCIANPRQQLLEGVSDLLLAPVKEATNYDGYPDGVVADIQELMQTQSHEISIKAKIKDLDLGQAMDLPMGLDITGAYAEIESAYDMQSGNLAVDLGIGMGSGNLGNIKLFLKEDELALDPNVGELLPNMYVMAFDSGLDFSSPVKFQERLNDLTGSSAKDNKELIDEFQGILNNYIDFITKNLDKKWVSSQSGTIDVFGDSQKCNTITLTIEGEDLQNLMLLILDKAQDDDNLASFVIDNFMSEVEDADDEYDDALDDAYDAIDDMDEDEVDDLYMETTVFFVKNAPVALVIEYEDSESDSKVFWKYITRGLEKDIEFWASEDDKDIIELTILNVLNKDVYEFEFDYGFEFDGEKMNISGEGEQVLEKDAQSVEMDMDIAYDDGYQILNFTESADMTWEAIKAGSEYELDGTFSISGGDGTSDISATLDVSGDMSFAKTVEVDIDYWDDDSIEVDSFEELLNAIMTDAFSVFGGFGGLTGSEDFT